MSVARAQEGTSALNISAIALYFHWIFAFFSSSSSSSIHTRMHVGIGYRRAKEGESMVLHG